VRRAAAALAALAAAALGGCGGDEAATTLQRASASLGDVRSGELDLRFLVSAQGARDADAGFAIEGPFALPDGEGELPQAELTYTQIAGPQRGAVTLVADGRDGWVRVGEQAYELPAERAERLRSSGGASEGVGGLDALDLERWIADPERSDGDEIDGVATDRITGRLRAGAALNDLFALGGRVGASGAAAGEEVDDEAAERLDEAGENATIAVDVGRDDGLLRRVRLRVAFPLEQARKLRGELGELRGAEVRFDMTLRNPNAPVAIDAPDDALPFSALDAAG
jgi:hypothetical protein